MRGKVHNIHRSAVTNQPQGRAKGTYVHKYEPHCWAMQEYFKRYPCILTLIKPDWLTLVHTYAYVCTFVCILIGLREMMDNYNPIKLNALPMTQVTWRRQLIHLSTLEEVQVLTLRRCFCSPFSSPAQSPLLSVSSPRLLLLTHEAAWPVVTLFFVNGPLSEAETTQEALIAISQFGSWTQPQMQMKRMSYKDEKVMNHQHTYLTNDSGNLCNCDIKWVYTIYTHTYVQ